MHTAHLVTLLNIACSVFSISSSFTASEAGESYYKSVESVQCSLFKVHSVQFNYCVWVPRVGVVQLSPTQTLFIIKIIIVINVKMYVHRILHFWRFKIFHSTKSLQNLFSFFLHWKYFPHLFACESDEFAVLYCEGFCVHDTWLAIHIHVNTYP